MTKQITENGDRAGFNVIASYGFVTPLAHINIKSSYRVSKYFVDVNEFNKLIKPLLK